MKPFMFYSVCECFAGASIWVKATKMKFIPLLDIVYTNDCLSIPGVERFCDAIELMIGRRISIWFKLCWKVITPAVTMVKHC